MKTCTKCKTVKSESEFFKGRMGKPRSWCKACDQAANLEYCRANKNRAKVWRTNRRLKNKGKAHGVPRSDVLKTCPTCKTAKPEINFGRDRGRGDGLATECKACRLAYRLANKGRLKTWNRELRLANQQRYALYRTQRRAKLAGALSTLTPVQWEAILELYGNSCAYCGKPGKMTVDHVVPVSRGGGTTPDNVVPACKSCNSSKGARTPQEWRN
jgi:5-methylcytosine-specific restriction endonuclease McrA